MIREATYSSAQYMEKWAEVERQSEALDGLSLADEFALCEEIEPGTESALLSQIGPNGWKLLAFCREFWLRPKQLAMCEFDEPICCVVGGRGGGKTRPAAEWVIGRLERGARVIVLVGPTYDDIKQFMLGGFKKRVDGFNGSGLFDCMPPWIEYQLKDDDGEIHFPGLGAVIYLHSAEIPEYRGPEPDTVWGDELLKWRYGERLLSNLRLACRSVGRVKAQMLLTTSPKKLKWLRDIVMDPDVKTINASTSENRGNVDSKWVDREQRRLGGTRQGEEELGGKLKIDDAADMFKLGVIDETRVDEAPSFDRLVVAVDPARVDKNQKSLEVQRDLTGIVLGGRHGTASDGHGYVVRDISGRYDDDWSKWGTAAVQLAIDCGASAIAIETNGAVQKTYRQNLIVCAAGLEWEAKPRPGNTYLVDLVGPNGRRIQIVEINASSDKVSRAGPVSTLYEKRRVHHVGRHPELEIELSDFPNNAQSPNRVDAVVHAMTELFNLDHPTKVAPASLKGLAELNAKADPPGAPQLGRGAQWLTGGRDRGRSI